MKRVGAFTCAFMLFAATAFGQNFNPGGVSAKALQKLSLIPTDQYITANYEFAYQPSTTAKQGLFQQQSTAAGVTMDCSPPFIVLTATTANKRALLWERGVQPDGLAVPMGVTDEVTIEFHVTNLDALGATTNGLFQFQYGDTNNYLVTKKPTAFDSFGIIVAGSGKSAAASVPTNKLTCYTVAWSGGSADTNYVSVGAPTSAMKVVIHANPAGGPIDFFVNDVQIASVPSQRQGGDPSNFSWSAWINGDASNQAVLLGPVIVQRIWP